MTPITPRRCKLSFLESLAILFGILIPVYGWFVMIPWAVIRYRARTGRSMWRDMRRDAEEDRREARRLGITVSQLHKLRERHRR